MRNYKTLNNSKLKNKNRNLQKIIIAVTNDLVTDQRVNKIASTLHSEGFEIELIGRKLPNSINLPNLPYKQTRMQLFFKKGFLFYAEYNIRLFIKLLFARFYIVTANDLDTLAACYYASIFRNKKIVYDSHEYFTEVPELLNNKFAKTFWTKLEAHIFPKLKYTSTVCKSIADIYSKKYNVNVKVVRNLPLKKSTALQEAFLKDDNKTLIIYQGAVNIGRGIETMIEAMRYIPNAVFLIIGGGDKEDELRQYVSLNKLNDKVQFTGKLHYTKLHQYTCMADLGISLEENMGLNYYYALPNKIFDYIQASTPIIASDLPEIKNIVETYKVGIVIKDRTPHNIANEINNLLNNKERIARIKENQSIAAELLCWENEKTELLKLYI
jgi:glycosyltransferase involved in cell wall biosynthesis